ncbi:unnamed protein product [Hymenolepis diminuta]|uniref:Transposase n=1 Tax=Hymenolepis diminuta TaxID=6216 RepID=A0A0R3SZG2_HYMDI|nr:unnamed protein product [Hymenolepis diminuta]
MDRSLARLSSVHPDLRLFVSQVILSAPGPPAPANRRGQRDWPKATGREGSHGRRPPAPANHQGRPDWPKAMG